MRQRIRAKRPAGKNQAEDILPRLDPEGRRFAVAPVTAGNDEKPPAFVRRLSQHLLAPFHRRQANLAGPEAIGLIKGLRLRTGGRGP